MESWISTDSNLGQRSKSLNGVLSNTLIRRKSMDSSGKSRNFPDVDSKDIAVAHGKHALNLTASYAVLEKSSKGVLDTIDRPNLHKVRILEASLNFKNGASIENCTSSEKKLKKVDSSTVGLALFLFVFVSLLIRYGCLPFSMVSLHSVNVVLLQKTKT